MQVAESWFSQIMCVVLGLLSNMIVVFSVFTGPSILFSTVALAIFIPTHSPREFTFLHSLSCFYCFWILETLSICLLLWMGSLFVASETVTKNEWETNSKWSLLGAVSKLRQWGGMTREIHRCYQPGFLASLINRHWTGQAHGTRVGI